MGEDLVNQRRLNRVHAAALGLLVGVLQAILDKQLRFAVFSPMLLGALVALVYTLIRTRTMPARWTLEAVLFGAVGAVVWWVAPFAVFVLMGVWLWAISTMFGAATAWTAELIWGPQSSIPSLLSDWGVYLGGALAGGAFGGRLGEFLVGLARELSGKQAWANKKHTIIGMLVGIALGAVYGVVHVRFYVMEVFVSW